MDSQVTECDFAMLLLTQKDLVNLGAMLALSAQLPDALVGAEGEIEVGGLE